MTQRISLSRFLLMAMVVSVVWGAWIPGGLAADTPPRRRPGRILIVRGIFSVFSLGMDELACKLSARGYQVDVAPPSMALLAAQTIEQEERARRLAEPIVIIGHSLGGRFCCTIPWQWRKSGMAVKLAVILDANPLTPVPDNVERCVNLYVTNRLGVFHGQDVWAIDPRTELINLDMTEVARPEGVVSVSHFSIDDSPWIQSLVLEEVEQAMGGTAAGSPSKRPRRADGSSNTFRCWDEANSRPVGPQADRRGVRQASARPGSRHRR